MRSFGLPDIAHVEGAADAFKDVLPGELIEDQQELALFGPVLLALEDVLLVRLVKLVRISGKEKGDGFVMMFGLLLQLLLPRAQGRLPCTAADPVGSWLM